MQLEAMQRGRDPRRNQVVMRQALAIVPLAAVLNIVIGALKPMLHLPIFLDTIGTGVAAIVLGPWWGALAGIIGNLVTGFTINPMALFFTPVNIASALIWGFGIRLGMGKTWLRFFILSLLVALGASLVTAPISVAVFGKAGQGGNLLMAVFLAMGKGLWVSAFASNFPFSLADKILSSFVALGLVDAMASTGRVQVPLVRGQNVRKGLWLAGGVGAGIAVMLGAMFAL